jgi:ribosomal protein S18 acetylase RimI-like enzyme
MVVFPEGFRLAPLERRHRRKSFDCGEATVNEWLRSRALQNQDKHLSSTKALLATDESLAGFYTLATGQVDFGELPPELVRQLPRRALPVAVLTWLGVDRRLQGQGLGDLLLAQALRDCHAAGQTFAFIAVVLDCLNDRAKAFYQKWDFAELPGHPYRLYLSAELLDALVRE